MFSLSFRMSDVISSFKSLLAGSQVFALHMLFHCVIVHTMWFSNSLKLLCIGHQYDVCKYYVGSVYVGGYGDLRESGPCVFPELYPVGFLVVGFSVVCSHVVCYCADDG